MMKRATTLTGHQIFDRAAAGLATILRGGSRRTMHQLSADYSHPHGAGVIGAGADGLLRAVLVEALTARPGSIEVLMPQDDLLRLFGDLAHRVPREQLDEVLRVADSLEDTIEYVEEAASAGLGSALKGQQILWIATPRADADVVYRTLQGCSGTAVTGLFNGLWPYGPTHVVEEDGPRPRPQRPVRLVTAPQAIVRLDAATASRM
ncbi:hypothetical protein ACFQ07_34390 [Actinomadura adrarensis]|uniref:Uncharacterized protein n=1 Tax=Actinomadura adrarensis TaxID=1819600 RepID=A0ABW3CUP5_9ACTN